MAGKIKFFQKTTPTNGVEINKSIERNNPVIRVPAVVKPIRIAVEPRAVPVQVRNVPVAIRVAKNIYKNISISNNKNLPLEFDI